MARVLLVEDEAPIREVQRAYLQRAGHQVLEVADGRKALDIYKHGDFDLVVLDLNLPQVDGVVVCQKIRETSTVPILMVTARTSELDEIIGLETGADDFIKKPFATGVFLARVETLLRRFKPGVLKVADLELDSANLAVKRGKITINLTLTQFNVLFTLAQEPNRVHTREEILARAYPVGFPRYISDRTIDAHIKAVRKAIETDHTDPRYIITVIGKGYKFLTNHD